MIDFIGFYPIRDSRRKSLERKGGLQRARESIGERELMLALGQMELSELYELVMPDGGSKEKDIQALVHASLLRHKSDPNAHVTRV